jgi:Protein of unknown function (DUF2950)
LTIIATLVAALCATNVLAQAPAATGGAAPVTSAVELALGEAVVADQGEELEAVPAFRRKTQSAGHKKGDAYHGYHFRILTRQGKTAPGGAYSLSSTGA